MILCLIISGFERSNVVILFFVLNHSETWIMIHHSALELKCVIVYYRLLHDYNTILYYTMLCRGIIIYFIFSLSFKLSPLTLKLAFDPSLSQIFNSTSPRFPLTLSLFLILPNYLSMPLSDTLYLSIYLFLCRSLSLSLELCLTLFSSQFISWFLSFSLARFVFLNSFNLYLLLLPCPISLVCLFFDTTLLNHVS